MRIGFFVLVGSILLALIFLFIFLIVYVKGGAEKKKTAIIILMPILALLGLTIHYQTELNFWNSTDMYVIMRSISTEYYGIMIGMVVTIIIMLPLSIVVWAVNRHARKEGVNRDKVVSYDKSKRDLFKKVAITVPTISLAGGAGLAAVSLGLPQINRIELKFKHLPAYLKNYKIAQISDVHIGPFYNLQDFQADMELLKKEIPNRLVITGDLIDSVTYLPKLAQQLEVLFEVFPDGIDYILGNHEYRNLKAVIDTIKTLKMRFLRNEAIQLNTDDNQPVYLVGVDYPLQQEKKEREEFLAKALMNVPNNAFTILLAHHPMFIEEAFEKNIPVTLTGHTHGGQFNLFGISLLPMPWAFWRGLYIAPNQEGYGYVSTGTGHWFPVRFNCPREITIFTFKEA